MTTLGNAEQRRQVGFGLLSGLLALTGLGLLLTASVNGRASGWPSVLPIGSVLALYVVAELSQIHVELRQHTLSVSVSDLPFVMGFFLLNPWWFLAARLVAAGVVFGLTRRSVSKSAFNLCLFTAEIGLGVVLMQALDVGDGTAGRDWLCTYGVVLLLNILFTLVIAAAMSLLGTRPTGSEVGGMLASASLSSVISTTLALMAIVVVMTSMVGLVLVAILFLAAALAYRAYHRLLRRHTDLGQLFAFTQTVGAAETTDDVVSTLLQRARDILRAETAVLRLPPAQDHADSPPTSGGPLIIPRDTRDPVLRHWLTTQGLREALLVPLRDGDAVTGVLQVSNRLGQTSTFGRDDLSLLQTLAAHAEAVWHNGRLVEQLRYDAHHDGLTGLGNRTYFQTALETSLSRSPGVAQHDTAGAGTAVLLLDLDRFKEVNDTLGHPVGDYLLRMVAQRIEQHVPPGSLVARLGGDEFAVLLRVAPGGPSGVDVATTIRDGLTAPFEVQGFYLEVGASIGVASIPADGHDASTLMQHADVAMYAAKRLAAGVAGYEARDDRNSVQMLAMAGELRRAIENGEIVMHLQPQIRLTSGKLVGYEALARWEHPTRGIIMPDDFIPLAEQTGLMAPLTHAALVQALASCSSWLSTHEDVGVAVNLSPRHLLDPELPVTVAELLRTYAVPPRLLTLEITESSLMTEAGTAAGAMGTLRALGVRLSVDDFGTGYSALAYLQRLPLDEVKIDKSFVHAMANDVSARAIVHSIIDLAHTLGLSVVAEGVEDEANRQALAELGCDLMQGYLLSRPLAPQNVAAWAELHENQSKLVG